MAEGCGNGIGQQQQMIGMLIQMSLDLAGSGFSDAAQCDLQCVIDLCLELCGREGIDLLLSLP